MLATTILSGLVLAASGLAQQTFQGGSVTYSLPPVLGACGRVCDSPFVCTQTGTQHQCDGGDAAIPAAVFDANFDASDPANSPICKSTVAAIGDATYNVGANVCDRCTTCGANDLELSESGEQAPGLTGLWLLITPSS